MVRKVFEKAGMIPGLQPGGRPQADPTNADAGKPRTAPGTMMGFLTVQSSAIQEAELLKGRVAELEGSAPLRRIDPATIKLSKWANRHEASFATAEFEQLKSEIGAAGGNVQPIKVRPLAVLNGSTPAAEAHFELIFGHRRHRACLELGIPVLAAVEQVSDVGLFEQMERENRGRKNLSPWEQGTMYRKALDEGLYPSLRRLADSLGVDVALVSKSLTLARLPDALIAAFSSPLEIQFRWASPLAEAVQKDPEGVVSRARELAKETVRPAAAKVFASLTVVPGGELNASTLSELKISKAGKKVGVLASDAKGRAVIRLEVGALPDVRRKALAKLIEDFLKS